MIQRINSLKKSVLNNYENKIDDLLSLCDSPIEQLMLIHLLNYFTSYRSPDLYKQKSFTNIEFIEDNLDPNDPFLTPVDRSQILEKINKYKYVSYSFFYEKTIGFKATHELGEDIPVEKIKRGEQIDLIFQEFEVYPQKEVFIDGELYRVDIAILLNRTVTDFANTKRKVIETRKIAIECDGYEYHSSKQQKLNDDIRTRKLYKDGWRVLRYSGSEINKIMDVDDFHSKFSELLDIFYSFNK